MTHASIELGFDAALAGRLREAMAQVAGVTGERNLLDWGIEPHVSLAVVDGHLEDAAADRLEAMLRQEGSLSIRLSSTGTFPGEEGVAFLAPVVSAELLALHGRVHDLLGRADVPVRAHYLPGAWVPHCTLGYRLPPERVLSALGLLQQAHVPQVGHLVSWHVHRWDGDDPGERVQIRTGTWGSPDPG